MNTDILIIGAGPAGLAAAASAAESGLQIDIIDDNFMSGGQIWRGGAHTQTDTRALDLWNTLNDCDNVRFHFQSKVIHACQQEKGDAIQVTIEVQSTSERQVGAQVFNAKKIILCTGARELLVPFPGWTLAGVTGAGGLQALSKAGYPVAGKRVIVAGTGPLLLAVAASLIERDAEVTHILEQAKFSSLSRFALGLLATPSKISQVVQLGRRLKEVIYHADSYVMSAHARVKSEALNSTIAQVGSATVSVLGEVQELPCDLLACGYGLISNTDLAAALNCQLDDLVGYEKVVVNEWQASTQENIYCAGEGTGIGGVDLALAEGRIAGYAASAQTRKAQKYFKERKKWQSFAKRLHHSFTLRPELKQLCDADTIVCRCEDVSYQELKKHTDWRDAKLHTRCGMGACQGRICGAANRVLFSWKRDAGRLPIYPAKIGSLISAERK
ncbi:FAD-dependent oxidoreductase [Undibacterium danionis]|uniref:FAD-dependent oxidoreductase n=1 Tax=Undibacterium danionis TaxID=1812100 RepID=A0ABV6IAU1_9BURK